LSDIGPKTIQVGASSSNEWFVKGPLGMGLDINTNGHNFVFCGGTGVLVFLDLVAQMCLQLCGITKDVFGPGFRLSLYYATQNTE